MRWTWVVPTAFLVAFLVFPIGTLIIRVGPGLHVAPATARIFALSLAQATASTLLALAVGVPLAAVVSRYAYRGRALAQALLTVPFVMPTVVVALAFRAMVGTSMPQGMALVVLAHAYVNLAVVVRVVGATWAQLPDSFEKVARSLGASESQLLREIILPLASPAILTGLQIALPVGMITTIVTEMLMGGSGVGGAMIAAGRFADSVGVFAGIIEIAILGMVVIRALDWLRARLLVWHPENRAH
jgi:ABC-type Fe3+ transport system permease subunit